MTRPSLARVFPLAVALCAALLVACLAVLTTDYVVWTTQENQAAQRLRTAADAAQNDAQASKALQDEVSLQTAVSLRHVQRTRTSGGAAVAFAALLVALLKRPQAARPPLPSTVACRVRLPDAPACSLTSDATDVSCAVTTCPPPIHAQANGAAPVDPARVDRMVARIGRRPRHLIPLLHALEKEFRYVPPAALDRLYATTDVTPAQAAGVTSFYGRFRTRPRGKKTLQVCRGAACHVARADRLLEELRRLLDIPDGDDTDPAGEFTIETVGCLGCCEIAPVLRSDDQLVGEVKIDALSEIVSGRALLRIKSARPKRSRWNAIWSGWSKRRAAPVQEAPGPQVRIVTERLGELDPTNLDDYQQHDGFAALRACLRHRDRGAVIKAVRQSGLRGRGGGGFPTADKWRLVAEAQGEKYVIVNGDEGDPGAFMDRVIMESFPFRVLEGMAIAAYAVGASRAVVYVRHEYPLAVERIRIARAAMESRGLLGQRIDGADFSLHVEVVEGAGAFVCGEETALIQSVMGQRGTPRHRPPYPAEQGLWGRPTLVNNVETLANVPWILRHGAEQFAAIGTPNSKGAKVFSLAGKVRHAGLIEVPMGTTIRQAVEQLGGGPPPGRRFKAVQIGGPSGGFLPAQLADTPFDYEALRDVGAIMGSGGLVVLDETDCMVDAARYFLDFAQHESCGHCTFCRVGVRKLKEMLERICAGKGAPRDLDEIDALSRSVVAGSLCGLGRTAPNPALTALRYFREEFVAHLQGRCPAGRCRALIRYRTTHRCTGCTLCAQVCPVGAIPATPYRQHVINTDVCTCCDACRTSCPENAIEVV